jgi:hypothetical protein
LHIVSKVRFAPLRCKKCAIKRVPFFPLYFDAAKSLENALPDKTAQHFEKQSPTPLKHKTSNQRLNEKRIWKAFFVNHN